jgi:type I restriction enzyme S subunit
MIPYYWSLIKMKFISNLQSGSNLTSEEIMESGLYPVYGGNGIRGYFNEYNTEGSFVLIGRQGALCGNINYADGKFWATEHAVVCHPRTEYDVVWFGSLLEIMNLNQYSISSAQPGLSVERIENLLIPIPPIEEQKRIGEYIGVKGKTIELAINELLSQIEDLKSYKSSVITEAVTGKVDLREWNKQIVTA